MKLFLKKHISWFAEHVKSDRLDSTAAHGAYFIIIAFLPFILFLFTIFNEFEINGSTLVTEMLSIFPDDVARYLDGILKETVATTGIISISVVTFLWSASSGMVSIIKGFDTIYKIKETRSFIRVRIMAIIYILIFAVALILTAVTLVFGTTIFEYLMKESPPLIAVILLQFKSLFGFVLLVFFFCLLFNSVPRQKVKFRNNLIGACFSAAGWVVFSYFFSIFVENFSNFSVVYGSLATLIILMFWLYTCMYIMFIGPEIAMWLE